MGLAKILLRRKTDDEEGDREGHKLKRALGVVDLTLLGVGATLGLGVYVLAGEVARNDAGPAIIISFLVAAIASIFAGFCYAEFAARVPRAGSAYVYSYVTVGELPAFIIGWNLILEYGIGTASVVRGLSNYIDSLLNKAMSKFLIQVMPISITWFSEYPDFLACVFILVLSILLAWGVKESSMMNSIFTVVNLLTVLMVIIVGAFYINIDNWRLDPDKAPKNDTMGKPVNPGKGGFAPFGISGIMAGAAICFFGFVGFDCVATTGEEAKNPKRNIPLSIFFSLFIVFLAYFGISTVLTLMCPYYLQDEDAPLPFVFEKVGLHVVKYIINTGAIFALCTSIFGSLFPLPRVLYAMANDGLLFISLSKVSPKRQTAVRATLVGGAITGVIAAIFDVEQLMSMLSIGTLLAYSIVAICVLILRYRDPNAETNKQEDHPDEDHPDEGHPDEGHLDEDHPVEDHPKKISCLKKMFNLTKLKEPNRTSEKVANWALAFYISATTAFCVMVVVGEDALGNGKPWAIALLCCFAVIMLFTLFILHRQPQANTPLSFKVPFLPLLPCISILINFYLMCMLNYHTWIRFAVWLFIGMVMYLFYSIRCSKEGKKQREAANAPRTNSRPSAESNAIPT